MYWIIWFFSVLWLILNIAQAYIKFNEGNNLIKESVHVNYAS